jgi:hypothetical protein
MFKSSWPALANLFLMLPAAFAEAHCPGNVASVHARHLAQYLNIVEVSVNNSGSYPFLLDTGAQITSVDPALASQFHLKPYEAAQVLGVASREAVPIAQLDDIQVGEGKVLRPFVAIQPLAQLQSADPSIRGVLGADFLRHFDVLIDQAHGLLCLGKAGEMRSYLHGEQLAFAAAHGNLDAVSTEPLILPVHLSGIAGPPLLLLLDSGANAPFLWRVEDVKRVRSASLQRRISADRKAGPTFSILPPQDMQIGKLLVHQISFAARATDGDEPRKIDIDGLLPTAQFKRVYIDYNSRFVVLESW